MGQSPALRNELRVVSGRPWTNDGRWVVVGPLYGHDCIVYDPGNGDIWNDLQDCLSYVREHLDIRTNRKECLDKPSIDV